MPNVKNQVLTGIKWSLFGKLVAQIFSWIVTFTVIRILTPEDYGIIELATAMISLGVALGVSGFSDVLVQKKTHDSLLCSQVLTVAALFNVSLFLLLFFTAPHVAQWYQIPALTSVIQVLSINILLISLTVVPAGILKREMNFKKLALLQMCQAITNSITTLILALSGFGYWSIAVGSFSGMFVFALLLNVFSKTTFKLTTNFQGFGHYFQFGMFTIVNRFLNFIFLKADVLIIGKLLGTSQLGYYSVGSQLANLPLEKVAQSLNEVSYTGYAKVKNDQSAIAYYFIQSSKIIALLAFSVFWGMASIAEPLINIVIGGKWLSAAPILQILALVMPFRIYQLAVHSAIAGIGFPKFNTKNLSVLCVLIPSTVYIGLQWGLIGAAIGWALGYMVFFIWMIIRSLNFLNVNIVDFGRSFLIPMLAGGAMFSLNYFLYHNIFEPTELTTLAYLIVIGTIIYFAVIFTLDKALLVKVKGLL